MSSFLESLEPKEAQDIIGRLRRSALEAEKTKTYLAANPRRHRGGFLHASHFLLNVRRDGWSAVYAEHATLDDAHDLLPASMLFVLPTPDGAVQFTADLVMWTEKLFELVDTVEVDGNIWVVFLF